MSSTYLSLHYHIVFGTKNREKSIAEAWRNRLHKYMAGTVVGLGGTPEAIGGTADHIHLLVGLKATHRLSDFMRELKKASSNWTRDELGISGFRWQDGYGAFSVSPNALETVKGYIGRQDEHHRTRTFREEFESLLNKAEIEFYPRFLGEA